MTSRQRTFLTDRFFAMAALFLLLGALSRTFPELLPFWLASSAVLAAWVIRDRRSLLESTTIDCRFDLDRTPEVGQSMLVKAEVLVRKVNTGGPSAIRLAAPASRCLRFASADQCLRLEPCERGWLATPSFHGHGSELGYERLKSARVQQVSRYHFWQRDSVIPVEETEFRVMPPRRRIPPQEFQRRIMNQRLLFQGTRQILSGQSPDQFHSSRPYQYPDPMRHIDARKSARYGKLMTRTFDSIFQHHLVIALDTSRTMRGEIEGSSKQDYYLSAALTLARSAILGGDQVSLVAFAGTAQVLLRRAKSHRSLLPLFRGDSRVSPVDEDASFESLGLALRQVAQTRSVVLVLTDATRPSAQESLLKGMKPLFTSHVGAVLWIKEDEYSLKSRISSSSAGFKSIEDYAGLLYSYWLELSERRFASAVNAAGGAALGASHLEWLTLVTDVYQLLRRSTRI